MPFGGRPSDACGPCRKKRLKCDRKQPSCTQCIRKSIICSGYRNVSELLFKDESESTARKVLWKRSEVLFSQILPEQKPERELLAVPDWNELDNISSPSRSVTPSQEDLALGYFMSSYVPASPFDYLPEIYNTVASNRHSAVSSAVLAASYASLSLRVGSHKLMNNARTHYSEALVRTNLALASSDTATLDSCLVAVLLLGLYEVIAFSSGRSSASWTAHTHGAVALIRMRGTQQLRTNLGTRLFLQTCNNIRSSCIQRGVAVPEDFRQIYEQAKPFLDPNIPTVRTGPVLDKVARFKARVDQILPVEDLPGLVHESLQLEEEVRALEDMLPDSWQYQVRSPDTSPACAYQGAAHIYPSHRVARHWNTLRITRLFLKEVVWRVAVGVGKAKEQGVPEVVQHCKDLDCPALQAEAMINRTQLITDILASATQFLDEDDATFTPAARFLIWPLTILVQLQSIPESARRYSIKCLYEVATQARIPQALEAARAIELGYPTDCYSMIWK